MKFRFLLFIILIASGKFLCAQNKVQHQIDSLKSIISSKVHDTVKFATYSNIAQSYWSINPNEGIPYAQKSLELAIKLNKKKIPNTGLWRFRYEL